MCCTSLRGAAFFGASIHIALGLLVFMRYVLGTIVLTFYSVNDMVKEKVTAFMAPFMVYVTLFLALGLLIFHSIEKGYFYLLKWAAVGFAGLQLLILVILLVLKFLPMYEYEQFPFLPTSITAAYTESPKDVNLTTSTEVEEEVKTESLILPLLTRSSSSSDSAGPSLFFYTLPPLLQKAMWLEPTSGDSITQVLPLASTSHDFDHHHVAPVVLTSMEKLRNAHIATFLVLYSLLNSVYLTVLYFYTRKLHHEAFFSQSEAISRRAAFYVHPQFAQGGPTDNKSSQQPGQPPNKLQINSTNTQESQGVVGSSSEYHRHHHSEGIRDSSSPMPPQPVSLPTSKFPIQNWAPKELPRFEPLPPDAPMGSSTSAAVPPGSQQPTHHHHHRAPPIPDRRRGIHRGETFPPPPRFPQRMEEDLESCSSSRVYTPPPPLQQGHGVHPREDFPPSHHVHNRRLSHIPPSTVPRPPPPARHLSFDTAPRDRYQYDDEEEIPPPRIDSLPPRGRHGGRISPPRYGEGGHRTLPQINFPQQRQNHPSYHQQSQPPPPIRQREPPPFEPAGKYQRYLPQPESASSAGMMSRPTQQRMLPVPPRGRHPTSVV